MIDLIGLLPALILGLIFWAWTDIWRSSRTFRIRAVWSGIAALPFLGFLVWLAIGPRAA